MGSVDYDQLRSRGLSSPHLTRGVLCDPLDGKKRDTGNQVGKLKFNRPLYL